MTLFFNFKVYVNSFHLKVAGGSEAERETTLHVETTILRTAHVIYSSNRFDGLLHSAAVLHDASVPLIHPLLFFSPNNKEKN